MAAMKSADVGLRALRALASNPDLKASDATRYAAELLDVHRAFDKVAGQLVKPSEVKKTDGKGLANQFAGYRRRLSMSGTTRKMSTSGGGALPYASNAADKGTKFGASKGMKPSEVRRLEKLRESQRAAKLASIPEVAQV